MKNSIYLKIGLSIIFALIMCLNGSNTFAISKEFENMINMLGVPKYNANRETINEDVYNVYKIFCYSAPEKYSGTSPKQRWKDSKYGLWNRLGGAFKGSGTRGEYMVLGKNYGGAVIHNYYFPLDTVSPVSPEKWAYYINTGALASWSDGKAYRFDEQRDYMKQAKLIFNDISSRDNADNPAEFREYNITAKSIGLDKAKLDTSSTWKTRGVISVKFMRDRALRYAYFFTSPIAANANVKANISSASSNYILEEDSKEIPIPIDYTAEAINLTGYAKKEHIKEIRSEIYIDNIKVGEISGSKTTKVGNRYNLVVSRQTHKLSPNNKFVIRVDSYMYTEFAIDGVMKDSAQKVINVLVEPEKIEPVNTYDVRQIEKENLSMVVRPLAQTIVTKSKESIGLVEAGRKLGIKLNLDVDVKDIEDIKVWIGKNQEDRESVSVGNILPIGIKEKEYEKDHHKVLLDFEIPKELSPTIYGWKSLRDKTSSYFLARENESIGTRKDEPYRLFIEFMYKNKGYKYEILIDTIDDYISNTNYTLEDKVLNKQEVSKVETVESWIENDN